MKIVIATNAFKEAAGPVAVAEAIARGCQRAVPDAEIILCPMADGGDGTAEALVAAQNGQWKESVVTGPMGESVTASWAILASHQVAVIEMASAAGLKLAPPSRRNPLQATTRGVGELMRVVDRQGCNQIIVGLGGSATVDGGTGMARELGFRFLDANGRDLLEGGGALRELRKIVPPDTTVIDARIVAATDVENPMTGVNGAARVFGPQKGASPEDVEILAEGLVNLSDRIAFDLGKSVGDLAGGGAAGGLAAGLVAFAGAEIRPGAALVAEFVQLAKVLTGASLVITGEGRLDRTTLRGKAPLEVARIAQGMRVPVWALAGSIDAAARAELGRWFVDCTAIAPQDMPVEVAILRTTELLEVAAEAGILRFIGRI